MFYTWKYEPAYSFSLNDTRHPHPHTPTHTPNHSSRENKPPILAPTRFTDRIIFQSWCQCTWAHAARCFIATEDIGGVLRVKEVPSGNSKEYYCSDCIDTHTALGEDKFGARARILNTKVAGRAPGKHPPFGTAGSKLFRHRPPKSPALSHTPPCPPAVTLHPSDLFSVCLACVQI